jgi:hypothetical protein
MNDLLAPINLGNGPSTTYYNSLILILGLKFLFKSHTYN